MVLLLPWRCLHGGCSMPFGGQLARVVLTPGRLPSTVSPTPAAAGCCFLPTLRRPIRLRAVEHSQPLEPQLRGRPMTQPTMPHFRGLQISQPGMPNFSGLPDAGGPDARRATNWLRAKPACEGWPAGFARTGLPLRAEAHNDSLFGNPLLALGVNDFLEVLIVGGPFGPCRHLLGRNPSPRRAMGIRLWWPAGFAMTGLPVRVRAHNDSLFGDPSLMFGVNDFSEEITLGGFLGLCLRLIGPSLSPHRAIGLRLWWPAGFAMAGLPVRGRAHNDSQFITYWNVEVAELFSGALTVYRGWLPCSVGTLHNITNTTNNIALNKNSQRFTSSHDYDNHNLHIQNNCHNNKNTTFTPPCTCAYFMPPTPKRVGLRCQFEALLLILSGSTPPRLSPNNWS